MPTNIYDTEYITSIKGDLIEISPLKIKYLKEFLLRFEYTKKASNEDEIFDTFLECCVIAMKQFYPVIKTKMEFEDNFDMAAMNKILKVVVNIDTEKSENVNLNNSLEDKDKSSWETLDLAKLESEAFLLGIWKNFDELESNISIPELMAILEQKRETDYQDKRFSAGIAGVDLEANKQEEDPWEAMKARVEAKVSGIGNGDPNDVTSLQGTKAQQMGFGIGMGLEYEVVNS